MKILNIEFSIISYFPVYNFINVHQKKKKKKKPHEEVSLTGFTLMKMLNGLICFLLIEQL